MLVQEQVAGTGGVRGGAVGGGQETDWIVTVARPDGMMYFVCTAPQSEFETYRKACGAVLDSVRFR